MFTKTDGLTLIPCSHEKSLLWDATCVDTLAPSHLPVTSKVTGSAAASAQHDLKCLEGILLEDVQESLPHCDKTLKALQNEIIYTSSLPVYDEFQKLWHSVAVESLDDLKKQGIRSMQDHGPKKSNQRKKP
ncbi:hypothetical protein ANN_06610 [Periplaneta americana]|uniref:Uncharacterized protein n=1 Tax=Periplaneta americana TaxID=6978 RepID=A0ABQ8TFT6_PERAM|nr:hypothetical protein ANN_06610 [Periplaneta americana]